MRPPRRRRPGGRGALLRAHHVAGNTAFIEALCRAVEAHGGRPLPVFCASAAHRSGPSCSTPAPGGRAGGHRAPRPRRDPRHSRAGGDRRRLDVARCRAGRTDPAGAVPDQLAGRLESSDDGLSPLDAATQVAIRSSTGRLITVPFSFKEVDATAHRVRGDRSGPLGWPASRWRHARLRHIPPAERGSC